jgi:uncharacterized membrane protein
MTTSDSLTKKIATNAVVAAIYFVLCIISAPIAYGQIQFRIAEMLILLCFWRPDLVFGVTLGCFLANINSSLGPWDMLIGTSATLISSLFVAYCAPRLIVAAFYPIIANGFVVAWELQWLLEIPFWDSVLWVSIGEATVVFASYILWVLLIRNKAFMNELSPTRHQQIRW